MVKKLYYFIISVFLLSRAFIWKNSTGLFYLLPGNHRIIVLTESEESSKNFLESCGCPKSCNFWNLMGKSPKNSSANHGKILCETRIQYAMKRYKMSRLQACGFAAKEGFCTQSCHPKVCTPSALDQPMFPDPQSPSITKTKMKKMIEYTLDARTKGQYHTLYDKLQCHDQGCSADFPTTLSSPGQLNFVTHVTTD